MPDLLTQMQQLDQQRPQANLQWFQANDKVPGSGQVEDGSALGELATNTGKSFLGAGAAALKGLAIASGAPAKVLGMDTPWQDEWAAKLDAYQKEIGLNPVAEVVYEGMGGAPVEIPKFMLGPIYNGASGAINSYTHGGSEAEIAIEGLKSGLGNQLMHKVFAGIQQLGLPVLKNILAQSGAMGVQSYTESGFDPTAAVTGMLTGLALAVPESGRSKIVFDTMVKAGARPELAKELVKQIDQTVPKGTITPDSEREDVNVMTGQKKKAKVIVTPQEPEQPTETVETPTTMPNATKVPTVEEVLAKTEELKQNADADQKVDADVAALQALSRDEVKPAKPEPEVTSESTVKKERAGKRTVPTESKPNGETSTEVVPSSEATKSTEEMQALPDVVGPDGRDLSTVQQPVVELSKVEPAKVEIGKGADNELEQGVSLFQSKGKISQEDAAKILGIDFFNMDKSDTKTVKDFVRDVIVEADNRVQRGEAGKPSEKPSEVSVENLKPNSVSESQVPSTDKVLSYIENNKADFQHGKAPALQKLATISGLKPSEVKTFLTEQGMLKDGKFVDKGFEEAQAKDKTLKQGTQITDPKVVETLNNGENPIIVSEDNKTVYVDFETLKVLNDSTDQKIYGTDVWNLLNQMKENQKGLKVVIVDSSSEKAGDFKVAGKLSFDKTAGTTKARFLEWATKAGVETGEVATAEERAVLAKNQVRIVPTTTKVGDARVPTFKVQSYSKGKWTTMNVTEMGQGKTKGAKYKVFKNEREAVEEALKIANKKESPLGEVVDKVKAATEPPVDEQMVTVTLDDGTKFGPFKSEEVAQKMVESNGWKDVKIERVQDTKSESEKVILNKLENSFSPAETQPKAEQPTTTLDNLGLQQLYEAVRKTRVVSDLVSHAQTFADHLISRGVASFKNFRRELKDFFGRNFYKIRDFAEVLWYEAKQKVWDKFTDESGEVGDSVKKRNRSDARKKAEAIAERLDVLEKEAQKRGMTLEELWKSKGGTPEQWKNIWDAGGELYKKVRAKREGLSPDTLSSHVFGMADKIGWTPSMVYEFTARLLGKDAPKPNEDFFKNLSKEDLKETWDAMQMVYQDQFKEKYKHSTKSYKVQKDIKEPGNLESLMHLGNRFIQRGKEWLDLTPTGRVIRQKIETVLNRTDIESGKLTAPLYMMEKYIEKHNDRLLMKYLGEDEFWKSVTEEERPAIEKVIKESEKTKNEVMDEKVLRTVKKLYNSIGQGMEDRFMTVTSLLHGEGKTRTELYRHDPSENYFPRMYQWNEVALGGKRREEMIKHIQKQYKLTKAAAAIQLERVMKNRTAAKKFGNMEYARDFNVPGWDRNIMRVSTEYAVKGTKRLYSIDEFGRKGEKANELLAKFIEEGGYGKVAQDILNKTIGVGEQSEHIMTKAMNLITTYQIITKMGLSAITNSTQSVNTWGLSDLRTMFRTIKSLHGADKEASHKFAYETGALLGTVMKEYMDWTKGDDAASVFLDKVQFTRVELYNRLFASVAGREFANRQFEILRTSKEGTREFNNAARKLRRLGLEFSKEELATKKELSMDEQRYAGLQMANKTQFRSNALTLPPIMMGDAGSKPIVRAITLLHSFAYHQSTMMKDLFKENKMRTLVVAAGMMGVGAALDEVKRLIRLKRPPASATEAVFGALSSAGGFGMVFDLLAAAVNGGTAAYIGGPIIGDIDNLGKAFAEGFKGVAEATGFKEETDTEHWKKPVKEALKAAPALVSYLNPTTGAVASTVSPAIQNAVLQPKGSYFNEE